MRSAFLWGNPQKAEQLAEAGAHAHLEWKHGVDCAKVCSSVVCTESPMTVCSADLLATGGQQLARHKVVLKALLKRGEER